MTTLSEQRHVQAARDEAFCAAHNLTSADAFVGHSPARAEAYLRDAEACLQSALDRVRDMRAVRRAFPASIAA